MAEGDLRPLDDLIKAALLRVLKEKELAYKNVMPLDKPMALAEFKQALAAFADYNMRGRISPRYKDR